jgi:hypothetical protein
MTSTMVSEFEIGDWVFPTSGPMRQRLCRVAASAGDRSSRKYRLIRDAEDLPGTYAADELRHISDGVVELLFFSSRLTSVGEVREHLAEWFPKVERLDT